MHTRVFHLLPVLLPVGIAGAVWLGMFSCVPLPLLAVLYARLCSAPLGL